MKQLILKIPAVIGMLLGLLSIVWYVESLVETVDTEIWIGSALVAMLSTLFFLIDAIISFVKARKQDDPKFNYVLALVLVISIPMVVIFGGDGKDLFNAIWNAYLVLILALEVVSIKRAWTAMKANRKMAK